MTLLHSHVHSWHKGWHIGVAEDTVEYLAGWHGGSQNRWSLQLMRQPKLIVVHEESEDNQIEVVILILVQVSNTLIAQYVLHFFKEELHLSHYTKHGSEHVAVIRASHAGDTCAHQTLIFLGERYLYYVDGLVVHRRL